MNNDTVAGKFDQVAGKVKQGIGEAVGNDKLANEGVADQVKGSAKETWGNVKDAAGHVQDNARARGAAESSHSGDSARNSIAQGAHNLKENIKDKLEDVKADSDRHTANRY